MRQLLPTTTYVMLVFLLTQVVIQSSDPRVPAEHWQNQNPVSPFSWLPQCWHSQQQAVKQKAWSSSLTAAAWDSTLYWAKLQCCKHSAKHQLISSAFSVLLLHSCNCWVPPHSLWRGVEGLFFSCESRTTFFSVEECSIQATKINMCQVQSMQLMFLWLKACINALPKYCRNLVSWLSTASKSVTENTRNTNISIFLLQYARKCKRYWNLTKLQKQQLLNDGMVFKSRASEENAPKSQFQVYAPLPFHHYKSLDSKYTTFFLSTTSKSK